MLGSSYSPVLLLGACSALLICGCVDNPEDPDDGRGYGRKCTWEVLDRGSGDVIERWTYAYEPRGYMIWEEVDYGGNGEIDFRIDYYFDDDGNLEREEIDENGDEEPDRLIRYFYDARGLRTLAEEGGSSGRLDLRRHFLYDGEDRLSIREDDYDADGEINSRTSWVYDSDDNPVRVEVDHGPDGEPNQIVAQDFEEIAGLFRLVLRRGDWDADGEWDYSHRRFWSDDGLLMGREIDETGDGEIDERWRYEYDESGNRVSGDGDTNGDGNWDVRQTYSTDCTVWREPDR